MNQKHEWILNHLSFITSEILSTLVNTNVLIFYPLRSSAEIWTEGKHDDDNRDASSRSICNMKWNFRAAMFDPDPHKQWRSERSRTQFRRRNREGPEQTQPTERKEIPIEAKRDPPPPAKAPWKTSIRMDFIKERPECNFQFRQCRNNECRICSDQKCSAM